MPETHWLATVELLTEWTIRVGALLVVPFRRSPEAAKSWLLLIFFLPIPGLVLYFLIGRTNLPRARLEILAKLPAALRATVTVLRQSPHIFHPRPGGDADAIRQVAMSLSGLDVLGGNGVDVYADYRDILRRIAADVDAATHHVHVITYILRLDDWTEPVFAALERAAARKVECRVLYDSYGSWGKAAAGRARLEKAGVQVEEALPVSIFRRKAARWDLRNHRKIVVVDGRVGWVGSMNLIAADFKPGLVYEDVMARATGPTVLPLQYVFTSDWFQEREEALVGSAYYPEPAITGRVAAQVLPSGPDFPGEGGHRLVVEMVHTARKRVVITTPYLVPDEALLVALTNAVLQGVEVVLILSARLDQVLVHQAQKSYYGELLRGGVDIRLYKPALLHAKHMTVDDTVALIGSGNMDIRSFRLNGEVSLVCYSAEVVAWLQAEQARCLEQSDKLDIETWSRRPFRAKFAQVMARLMSPLL